MCTAASRGLCCGPNTFSRVFQLLQAVKCGRMYIWGLQRRCGSIRGEVAALTTAARSGLDLCRTALHQQHHHPSSSSSSLIFPPFISPSPARWAPPSSSADKQHNGEELCSRGGSSSSSSSTASVSLSLTHTYIHTLALHLPPSSSTTSSFSVVQPV